MRTEKLNHSEDVFFTSDPHFFHKSMVDMKRRPFTSVDEMNEVLVANWNSVVGKNSIIYVLGDVSFGSPEETHRLLERLNGNKRLILGNHDGSKMVDKVYRHHFMTICDRMRVKFLDIKEEVVLDHFPLLTWDKAHYGAWHLHGHSHGSMRYPFEGKILDVGVDVHNFTPINVVKVFNYMHNRPIHTLDHHTPRVSQ